eukprot:TRINITY_DN26559_c0_g1_i1.p1 TRINITY_DN26559_c0_g1~~TRINITY_DN26559_c0_g1_i1.p1  ORF type:complete len:202 (-),score=12.92 TRINITY_DN26559_c0_g1_i1:106-711(-)
MAQSDTLEAGDNRGGAGGWIFRLLVVAGAAFMLYSWFMPWWGADIAVLPGGDHLLMRPWGIEVAGQVRVNADASLWSMPWFFEPFMWTYLTVCMLILAVSLFLKRRVSLGRMSLSLAAILIALVGLSYLIAVGLAYGIGELRAQAAGSVFVGESTVEHAMTGNKVKMEAALKDGYWLALAAGPVLIVLALLRGLFVRDPKA